MNVSGCSVADALFPGAPLKRPLSKLDWALAHARRGFSVFPLVPNTKVPPKEMDRWQYRASSDETQIREWWTRWPDANIAGFAGSHLVVDIDPRNGGKETFEALTLTEEFPKTLVSKTAGGGNHCIYALPAHTVVRPPKAGLGPGVDLKSWGGYIVLPGSTINGNAYEWMNERAPALAPQWMIDRCKAPAKRADNAGSRLVAADDAAIAAAEAWIRNTTSDVLEGERDNTAFKVAARLYDFGADYAGALELLAGWNEARCVPPLSAEDLARVARSAGHNRQKPIGIYSPSLQVFEPIEIAPRQAQPQKRAHEEGLEAARTWVNIHGPAATEADRVEVLAGVLEKLLSFGLDGQETTELLETWNLCFCAPPFAAEKIRDVVNGELDWRKSQGEAALPFAAAKAPAKIKAAALRQFDPATIPPVPWVVPGLAARRAISTLTGPGGVSKSTWTLQLAIAVAAGRSDICGYNIAKRERVWVWSQEDDINQMELRVAAIMQAFGVTREDLRDAAGRPMLYLNSGLGRGNRLTLVKRVGDTLRESEQLAAMLTEAKTIQPGLVVLDPLVSLHQAGENDNMQMRAVFDCISLIAVEANSAVLIVSHTGKPDKGSSKGFAGDSYASRGASAQPDAARVAATFMGLSEDDAKKRWRLPASKSHLDYVRIDDSKSNLGKLQRTPRLFAREDVIVAGFTGDSMQVLRPIALELRVKTGAPDMAHNIAKAIAENLARDTPHTVPALLPYLPGAEADALRENKNRARILDAAFDGADVNECLTDFGILRRAKGTGNKGTLLTLSPAPQHLKMRSEEQLNA